ncbi:MAG: hypothetical protein LBV74_14440 [Tannerella sp.]|jgi:hypothetical protein|nr:hypothetical protein [Tannerella sp.]
MFLLRKIVCLGCLLLFYTSCSPQDREVERGFYFWKSAQYSLLEEEKQQINALNVQKLYVKFFEIAPDPVFGVIPESKTSLHIWDVKIEDPNLSSPIFTEIVPTVFIKNEIFKEISNAELDTLAQNILFLTNRYYQRNYSKDIADYKELQLDCDWTAGTKDNYFYLLKALKQSSGKLISCTLRLYPYKYRKKTGIPPVDKVTLMCYNLISPLANKDMNSILDVTELEKYLLQSRKYPVHVDIALPVYSWIHIYRNNQFVKLINGSKRIFREGDLIKIKPLWYEIQRDVFLGNYLLRAGDQVKIEDISIQELYQTIDLLKNKVKLDKHITVTLFHLDENNLIDYDIETLDSFYTRFY